MWIVDLISFSSSIRSRATERELEGKRDRTKWRREERERGRTSLAKTSCAINFTCNGREIRRTREGEKRCAREGESGGGEEERSISSSSPFVHICACRRVRHKDTVQRKWTRHSITQEKFYHSREKKEEKERTRHAQRNWFPSHKRGEEKMCVWGEREDAEPLLVPLLSTETISVPRGTRREKSRRERE